MERKQIGFEAFGCASWKTKLVSDTNSRCHFPLVRRWQESTNDSPNLCGNYPRIVAYSVQTPREKPTQLRMAPIQATAIHRADEASEAEVGWLIHTAVIVADSISVANLALGFLRRHGARFGTPRLDAMQSPSRWLDGFEP